MRTAAALLVVAAGIAGVGCSRETRGTFLGYVEGEYVHVASPVGGTLVGLAVARGGEVEPGQLLFELDPEPEASVARESEQRLSQARSRLEDLTKGRRPSEIEALAARLERARAELQLAAVEAARLEALHRERVVSTEERDRAQATLDAARAEAAGFEADLETARLGGRVDEIRAAAAEVEAAEAALATARWTLAKKRPEAPVAARVHDTLYRPGEWVAAGSPVVSLLPPGNVKLRFFVPEPQLAAIHPGASVVAALDGVPEAVPATVSYVSTEAEFTPPVIYSRETRAKLVYMVEATFAEPERAGRLRPGQPADVRPSASAR